MVVAGDLAVAEKSVKGDVPMKEHPHSIWTLGLGGESGGTPAPADLESWGATWKAASDDYLIGLAAKQNDAASMAMPALIESERRLRAEIAAFNAAATAQVSELVTLSKEAGRQADRVIRLTWWIAALTVILGVIALLQLMAMFAGKG